MKICHVCLTECDDSAELCPLCGADLTESEEKSNEEKPEEIIIKNPVLVASVEDVVSSEIFKDILKENNIPFSSESPESDTTLKVMFGGNFVADDIYVDEKDFEKADALYNDFLNNEPEFDDSFFEEENTENNEDSEDK